MSYLPAPGAPVPGQGPHAAAAQPLPPQLAAALPTAFAHPDPQWRTFQALRWTTMGLAIAALLTLVAVPLSLPSGNFSIMLVLFLVTLLLLFAALGTAIAMWVSLSGAQRALGDALTHTGYPGVDARRLYATRPVPTAYGFWLRSRRERRPDGTWLIIEPTPGGPNGPASASPRMI